MITAGSLREIIKIQKPVRVQNDTGGVSTSYEDVITRTYAEVKEDRSNSPLIAGQENIINSIKFKIRYRPVEYLKIGYRIVWRDFNYTIRNIKVGRLRTYIEITSNADMETSER